jgi:hypothetical protein
VLGIVGLIPPIGFAAFTRTALIILIVSILLAVRARSGRGSRVGLAGRAACGCVPRAFNYSLPSGAAPAG